MPVKKHSGNPQAQAVFHICQDGETITYFDDPATSPRLGESYTFRENHTLGRISGEVVRIDRIRENTVNHIWVYLKPTDPCKGCEHREHRG